MEGSSEGLVGVPGTRTIRFYVDSEAETRAQFNINFYLLGPGLNESDLPDLLENTSTSMLPEERVSFTVAG